MTDQDALKAADKPDWWMGPDGELKAMRSLRQALDAVASHAERTYLFRPGGFGDPAVWLGAEDIVRLRALLAEESERAA